MTWSLRWWWPLAIVLGSSWATVPESLPAVHEVPVPSSVDAYHVAAFVAAFRFDAVASEQLTRLWTESVEARAERVACIGGVRRDGIALVTRVRELSPDGADSAHIPASSSLDECRPPIWFGTVHTHIATFEGIPYTTFSPSDRDVMARWNRRWRADGVFCVLYSETVAHCEVGNDTTDDMAYSAGAAPRIVLRRGNIIGATH